jgi:hypothetical protein
MTALAAAVTAKDTMIRLDGPVAAPYGTRITLDKESLSVVAGDGTATLTVWRAQNGTAAAAHPAGTTVIPVWYGLAQWPVQVPAGSSVKGQQGAAITFPGDGSILFDSSLSSQQQAQPPPIPAHLIALTPTGALGGIIVALPTADPHVAGQLWNKNGTVSVSAG